MDGVGQYDGIDLLIAIRLLDSTTWKSVSTRSRTGTVRLTGQ